MTAPAARRRRVEPLPDGCRCKPTKGDRGEPHRWPTIHAWHVGEAQYVLTLRHHARCGLPAQPVDATTWRRR